MSAFHLTSLQPLHFTLPFLCLSVHIYHSAHPTSTTSSVHLPPLPLIYASTCPHCSPLVIFNIGIYYVFLSPPYTRLLRPPHTSCPFDFTSCSPFHYSLPIRPCLSLLCTYFSSPSSLHSPMPSLLQSPLHLHFSLSQLPLLLIR